MTTLTTTMTGTAKQSRKSKRHLPSTLLSRIPDTCRNANEAATTLGRLLSQNVVQEYMLRFKSRRNQHRDHGDSSAEDFVSSLILDEVYERSNLPGSIAVLTSFFDGLVYEVSKQENNMLLSRSLEQIALDWNKWIINLVSKSNMAFLRVATTSLVQFLAMNLEHLQSITEKLVRQIYFEDFSCIPCMRRLLIGESIRMASRINDPYLVNQFLMPILSMSILRPCSSNLKEKLFVIESMLRILRHNSCSDFGLSLLNANQTLLSQFLDRFVIIDKSRRLTGSKREELYEQRMSTLEFLTNWIIGYIECMVLVMCRQNNEIDTCSNEEGTIQRLLSSTFDNIFGVFLPIIIFESSPGPLFDMILYLINQHRPLLSFNIQPKSLYRFVMSILLQASEVHVCEGIVILRTLLSDCFKCYDAISYDSVRNICMVASCIWCASSYSPLVDCSKGLLEFLLRAGKQNKEVDSYTSNHSNNLKVHHLVALSGERTRNFLFTMLRLCNTPSVLMGEANFVFSLSQLLSQRNGRYDKLAILEVIKESLSAQPSLCFRFIPVASYFCNEMISEDPKLVLITLRILCRSAPQDKHCAKQIWQILSAFTCDKVPNHLRTVTIRLYAHLLQDSRRLLDRVNDSLLSYINDTDEEIRVAVVMTISDMCLIDSDAATEFVGPLQIFLRDDSYIVQALAIKSLHLLCASGVMQYDLVIKALSKRLNFELESKIILKQNTTLICELCNLLGDGECDDDDSSCDSDNELVSSQTSRAVNILLDIVAKIVMSTEHDKMKYCVETAFYNLNRYSYEALGIDGEMIRRATDGDLEKCQYNKVVSISSSACTKYFKFDEYEVTSLVQFMKKIVAAEQDALGPLLFKRAKQSIESGKKATVLDTQLDLPFPPNEFLRERFHNSPSIGSGFGMLYGTNYSSTTELLEDISDVMCEVQSYENDFVENLFIVNGVLAGMHKLVKCLRKFNDEEKKLIEELHFLSELNIHDNYHLFISAFCCVHSSNSTTFLNFVEDEYKSVLSSIKGGNFESIDHGMICLSLLGSRFTSMYSIEKILHIVEEYETEFKSNVIHSFFGAHYGASILSQALLNQVSSQNFDEALAIVCKLLTLLLKDLMSCIEGPFRPLEELIRFLSTGKWSSTVLRLFESTRYSVTEANKARCKSLCIALSASAPCFPHLHRDFLQCMYQMMLKMPHGVGKGYAISTMLELRVLLHDIEQRNIRDLYDECITALDVEKDVGDLFLVLVNCSIHGQDISFQECLQTLYSFATDLNYSASIRESSLIAMCSGLCLIPGLAATCTVDLPKRRQGLKAEDVKFVTDMCTSLADQSTRSFNLPLTLLGLLSVFKSSDVDEEESKETCRLFDYKTGQAKPSIDVKKRVPFSVYARNGTLCDFALSEFYRSSSRSVDFLLSLQNAHLPPKIVTYLKRYLLEDISRLSQKSKGDNFRKVMDFLKFQISHRRGSVERNGYVQLFIDLSCKDLQFIVNTFGTDGIIYMILVLREVIFYIPSGLVENVFTSIWASCTSQVSANQNLLCAHEFVRCLEHIFHHTSTKDIATRQRQSLSPIVKRFCEDFTNIMFDSIVHLFSLASAGDAFECNDLESLWKDFGSCLSFLPNKNLDDHLLYSTLKEKSTSNDHFVCSALLCLDSRLCSNGIRSILRDWSLQTNLSDCNYISFQRIFLALASSHSSSNDKEKHRILVQCFESLFLPDTDCDAVFDVIAVYVTIWQHSFDDTIEALFVWWLDVSNNDELLYKFFATDSNTIRLLYEIIRNDFPLNIRIISYKLGITDILQNFIFQLLTNEANFSQKFRSYHFLRKAYWGLQLGDGINDFSRLMSIGHYTN